jgi:2,5-dihydroxypyridine 5,6-dioxygenase
MSFLYEYELGKASEILTRDLLKLKPGETCVITADTESDFRVVNAIARATFACDAKPMVVWTASPLGVAKAADPMLPVEALTGALKNADVWVELNNEWLLYSTPYDIAMRENLKLRHNCLVGLNADMMIRCIGRIDYRVLKQFMQTISEMTSNAKHVRITTPAGEDVEFDNDPERKLMPRLGYADTPGSHMMAGQIGWKPIYDSINGVVVYDGSVVPPIGLLQAPIFLHVAKGEIVKIEGGKEAAQFDAWLRGFHHSQMLRFAHLCYGFNPGARLCGNILEDERVWGATEWGIGQIGPMYVPPEGIKAPSHTDGICLNSSIWLDGKLIMERGSMVETELAALAKQLGKE